MSSEVNFDNVMGRMLSYIDDKYDKRETSVLYQSIAMVVPELLLLRSEMEIMEDEAFPDTCNYVNLVRFAELRGITPRAATHGMISAEFNIDVELGTRFNCDKRNYSVYAKIGDEENKKTYELLAEEIGHIETLGDLTPINDVEGLTSAKAIAVLEDGRDEETLESLRTRYMASLDYQAFGGNRQEYINKVMNIENVGACKVFRREPSTSSELGKVDVMVLDSTYKDSPSGLIEIVQNTLDPQKTGSGHGLAPIGHFVNVIPVNKVTFNVHTTLTVDELVGDITEDVKKAIESYLNEIRIEFGNTSSNVVRISKIENKILDITGVLDIAHTTINGEENNLSIDDRSIPILGGVTYDRG